MTDQELYNRIRDHLLKQGRQSRDRGSCLYRSPEGYTCAAGCLIDDEHYTPALEGMGVLLTDSPVRPAISESLQSSTPLNWNLIDGLQHAHDGDIYWHPMPILSKQILDTPEAFQALIGARLEKVARHFGLEP